MFEFVMVLLYILKNIVSDYRLRIYLSEQASKERILVEVLSTQQQ
jgi:hypothetical protein